MKMLRHIFNFLTSDVKSENETKKVAVILRFCALIICFYFLLFTAAVLIDRNVEVLMVAAIGICIFSFIFWLTYQDKTQIAAVLFIICIMTWIILNVRIIGWDSGVQHFIFFLILMIFPVLPVRILWKVVLATGLWISRIVLYFYGRSFAPVIVIDSQMGVTLQILNTAVISVLMIIVLIIYTSDSAEMERKLIIYNKKLHKMANIDPLTQLWNRRGMYDLLEKSVEEYRESRMNGLSLAIADIDFFKKINDRYGHEGGDEVLKVISKNLMEMMEACGGSVGRWGGEEFLLVFDNKNGDEACLELERIRRELKKMFIPYRGEMIQFTVTFGLAEYDPAYHVEESIRVVDNKLYRGKEAGRDRIVY